MPDLLLNSERPFAAGARDPLTGRPLPWAEWLARGLAEEEAAALRQATRTGRPCGSEAFVRELEGKLVRPLPPQKRAPSPRRPKPRKSRGCSMNKEEIYDLFGRLAPKFPEIPPKFQDRPDLAWRTGANLCPILK